jgi:hypothetical protein
MDEKKKVNGYLSRQEFSFIKSRNFRAKGKAKISSPNPKKGVFRVWEQKSVNNLKRLPPLSSPNSKETKKISQKRLMQVM